MCQTLKSHCWSLWLELKAWTSGQMFLCIYKELKGYLKHPLNASPEQNHKRCCNTSVTLKFTSSGENCQHQTKKKCRRKQVTLKSLKMSSSFTGRKTDFKCLHSFLPCRITFLTAPQNRSNAILYKIPNTEVSRWCVVINNYERKAFFNCDNNV